MGISNSSLYLENWIALDSSNKVAIAQAIAANILGMSFIGIEIFGDGHSSFEIATFEYDDARFLLIPGNKWQLGYNAASSPFPNKDFRAAWSSAYKIDFGAIEDQISLSFSEAREVDEGPFLIEQVPREAEVVFGEIVGYPEVQKHLEVSAWGLPTLNQWETAHRGGSHTVFPWGEDPVLDHSTRPVLSDFGFKFPTSYYHYEFIAERGILVGGDGGGAECGGFGRHLLSFMDASCFRMDTEEWGLGPDFGDVYVHFRRCMPVDLPNSQAVRSQI